MSKSQNSDSQNKRLNEAFTGHPSHATRWCSLSMHLVSTYLPPSAASHAVKCNFGRELLVVARINRLDVLELLDTGAKPQSSLELLPRIVAVHEIAHQVGSFSHLPCSLFVSHLSPGWTRSTVGGHRSSRLFCPYRRILC